MIGKHVAHYEIVEKLGEGGMGVVYKAHDEKLDRFVALKFLPPHLVDNPEQRLRFSQEAQAVSSLDHPNVVTIYDINETPTGETYIVMAHYDGVTLKTMLDDGALPVEKVLRYAVHIGRGLSRAHDADVTHRDIKPANIIIVNRHDEAKILDFGIAKLSRSTGLTRTGTTMGTVSYMSPEQARGERVDHRTDIWSLGVMMFEMITGERPFNGEFEQAIIYSILNEEEPRLAGVVPDLPETLGRVVHRCMAKRPEDRFAGMHELLETLEPMNFEFSGGDSPVSGTVTYAGRARTRKRRWVVGLAGGALAVAAAGFWWFSRPADDGLRSAASAARKATRLAERQAIIAGAHEFSADAMSQGDSLVTRAQAEFDAGRFAESSTLFDVAAATFNLAADAATELKSRIADRQRAEDDAAKEQAAQKKTGDEKAGKDSGERAPPAEAEPATEPATPRVSAVRSADAARQRDAMLLARAQLAGFAEKELSELSSYTEATKSQGDGERLYGDGDYTGALASFKRAAILYESALDAARQMAERSRQDVSELQARVRELRGGLTADHRFLPAYRDAVEAEELGDKALAASGYAVAVDQFEKAAAGYELAKATREKQIADIHALVGRYKRALEAEDLAALGSLYESFSPRVRNDWASFFDAVSELRAQMDVQSIEFGPGSATTHISVHFLYSGAGGGDEPVRWVMTMLEDERGWLIKELHQKD